MASGSPGAQGKGKSVAVPVKLNDRIRRLVSGSPPPDDPEIVDEGVEREAESRGRADRDWYDENVGQVDKERGSRGDTRSRGESTRKPSARSNRRIPSSYQDDDEVFELDESGSEEPEVEDSPPRPSTRHIPLQSVSTPALKKRDAAKADQRRRIGTSPQVILGEPRPVNPRGGRSPRKYPVRSTNHHGTVSSSPYAKRTTPPDKPPEAGPLSLAKEDAVEKDTKKAKKSGPTTKAKMADQDAITQKLLKRANSYYRALVATVSMFPNTRENSDFVKAAFLSACDELSLPDFEIKWFTDATYRLTLNKIISAKGPHIRNVGKGAALSHVPNLYSFPPGTEAVKRWITRLKKDASFGSQKFDPISGRRDGWCDHEIFSYVLAESFFPKADAPGFLHPELFEPIKPPLMAFLLTVTEAALDVWEGGSKASDTHQMKESRYKDIYETHLENIKEYAVRYTPLWLITSRELLSKSRQRCGVSTKIRKPGPKPLHIGNYDEDMQRLNEKAKLLLEQESHRRASGSSITSNTASPQAGWSASGDPPFDDPFRASSGDRSMRSVDKSPSPMSLTAQDEAEVRELVDEDQTLSVAIRSLRLSENTPPVEQDQQSVSDNSPIRILNFTGPLVSQAPPTPAAKRAQTTSSRPQASVSVPKKTKPPPRPRQVKLPALPSPSEAGAGPADNNIESMVADLPQASEPAPAPPKKGRGRPRKQQEEPHVVIDHVHVHFSDDTQTLENEATAAGNGSVIPVDSAPVVAAKKARGRPRKQELQQLPATDPQVPVVDNGSHIATVTVLEGKSRKQGKKAPQDRCATRESEREAEPGGSRSGTADTTAPQTVRMSSRGRPIRAPKSG